MSVFCFLCRQSEEDENNARSPAPAKSRGEATTDGTTDEAPRSPLRRRRRQALPGGLAAVLERVYNQELETSLEDQKHVNFTEVRDRISEVHREFPDVTSQQIRDKLFTMMKKIRLERRLRVVKKGSSPANEKSS